MCAASPARNRRPCRIGSATKLRIGVTLESKTGPSLSDHPGTASRLCSSAQIRSSGQSARSVSTGTCRYSRLVCGLRIVCSANPSGCRE